MIDFLDDCFGSFRACCFCYVNQWVKKIFSYSFSFRLVFLYFCFNLVATFCPSNGESEKMAVENDS